MLDMTDDSIESKPFIVEMLRRAGRTYEEAQATENWFSKWRWPSRVHEDEYRDWFMRMVKSQRPRWSKDQVLSAWAEFDLKFGLASANPFDDLAVATTGAEATGLHPDGERREYWLHERGGVIVTVKHGLVHVEEFRARPKSVEVPQ